MEESRASPSQPATAHASEHATRNFCTENSRECCLPCTDGFKCQLHAFVEEMHPTPLFWQGSVPCQTDDGHRSTSGQYQRSAACCRNLCSDRAAWSDKSVLRIQVSCLSPWLMSSLVRSRIGREGMHPVAYFVRCSLLPSSRMCQRRGCGPAD